MEVAWKRALRALQISHKLWKSKHGGGNLFDSQYRSGKVEPEDIAGAVVENESQIAKWTVEKLKFWLECRHLNQHRK